MLVASARSVGEIINAVSREYELVSPKVVAVGGGAGGLGRFVANSLGLECLVPPGAEVISSIGDALSLVRVERERTIVSPRAEDSAALAAEAEEACVAAGASPASVDVRVEYESERSTLRAIATGAVGLEAGQPARAQARRARRSHRGLRGPWIGTARARWARSGSRADGGDDDGGPVLVLDRFGDVVSEGWGSVVQLADDDAAADVGNLVKRYTRQLGPMTHAADRLAPRRQSRDGTRGDRR